jgi:hypothetical protein
LVPKNGASPEIAILVGKMMVNRWIEGYPHKPKYDNRKITKKEAGQNKEPSCKVTILMLPVACDQTFCIFFYVFFFSGRTCEFTALIGVVQARAGCDEQWLVRQIAAETQRGRQELERRSQLPRGPHPVGLMTVGSASGICQWSLYFPNFGVAQHHLLDGNILVNSGLTSQEW